MESIIKARFFSENYTGIVEYLNGNKAWYLNGLCHRVDGPAIEYSNGTRSWYFNGKVHREDGPAIESFDGHKHWYLNGELHRVDGPAIEHPNHTTKYWYLDNINYSQEEWFEMLSDEDKLEAIWNLG